MPTKQVKFVPSLVDLILKGEKTATTRLFDDKDLQTGDIIELVNRDTKKVFGLAEITHTK